jgi:pimeloyl-ACP methyl ester carboxylesterase
MHRRAALLAVLSFALTSCGGDDSDNVGDTKTTASKTDASSPREVTAQVDGRKLSGHCRGTPSDAPAVVVESGIGSDRGQLWSVEEHLARRTVVCAYDRAGVGKSDPPPKPRRPVTDAVKDLDAFITAAELDPPYFLVGQSAGATIVFMNAQSHPETVAGFVSMNPVPPSKTFIKAARQVETPDEVKDELAFDRGENDEGLVFTASERMLTDGLPPTMPYAVMFDEDCGGATEFCGRILPPLTRVTESLAGVGEGGRFVRAKGAGHDIYSTDPELVHKTVDDVMNAAAGG